MKTMRWTIWGVALAAITPLTTSPLDAQRSGVEIWAETCGNCHTNQPARRYTADQWQTLVTHMMIVSRLPDDDAAAVLRFLQRGARTPGEPIADGDVDRPEDSPPALFLASRDPGSLDLFAYQGPSGARLYSSECKSCHGGRGKGDGRAGRTMDPRPTDISDPEYLEGISDSTMIRIIVEGQGEMDPTERELTTAELNALVAYVRRLGEIRAAGR